MFFTFTFYTIFCMVFLSIFGPKNNPKSKGPPTHTYTLIRPCSQGRVLGAWLLLAALWLHLGHFWHPFGSMFGDVCINDLLSSPAGGKVKIITIRYNAKVRAEVRDHLPWLRVHNACHSVRFTAGPACSSCSLLSPTTRVPHVPSCPQGGGRVQGRESVC